MAVKSMTGFGRGEIESGERVWSVETRCVNHRYLDLKMKLPGGYSSLEEKIRKKVSMFHHRGRVDLLLGVTGNFTDLTEVRANLDLAKGYRDALHALSLEFGLEDGASAAILASYPDVLIRERKNEDLEELWPLLERAFDDALKSCDIMRIQEGENLARDLLERLDIFTKTIDTIEIAKPQNP